MNSIANPARFLKRTSIDPEALPLNEAATHVGVSNAALRGWCKSGRVKCHRVGARKEIFIPRSEVERIRVA